MDNAMPYMYNPNIGNPNMNTNTNPNFNNRSLRELTRRIENLERRVSRLERRISNMPFRDNIEEINNEYYPPANDNYML